MDQLKREADKLFEVTGVNTDASHLLISLRSKQSGEAGRMQFRDPDGLLAKIGLVRSGTVESSAEQILFERGSLSELKRANASDPTGANATNATGAYRLLAAGRGVELEGPAAVLLKDKRLNDGELTVKLQALDAAPQPEAAKPAAADPAPDAQPAAENETQSENQNKEPVQQPRETAAVGPSISLKIGDVELQGQHLERRRVLSEADAQAASAETAGKDETEEKKQKASESKTETAQADTKKPAEGLAKFLRMGVGVVFQDGRPAKEVIREIEVGQPESEVRLKLAELSGGAPLAGVYFFQPDGGKGRVADLMIQPAASTEQQMLPVHETSAARDAIVKVNGVEVRRGENKSITDIIQGLSLDLNRRTQGPVTISVTTNTDEMSGQIKEWVAAYNELMLFLRENSKADGEKFIPPVQGEDDQNRPSPTDRQGIFASDSTVRQLIATIRTTAAQSYPSTSKPAYRVLSDIGISTGGVGAKWEDVQYGFLQIEEEKLTEALRTNPESVRELFASDTNEDTVPDNGVAVNLEEQLRPYNRASGGLIAARITMLKDQITANKEEMFRKERSIEAKQQNLRERFGRMEQAVQQNRSMGQYLKQNAPQ